MALFDDYLAPRQFGEGGGLLGRLLALQQQQNQYQPGAGFDTAPVPQMAPPTPWSNLPGDRASSGERSAAPNLNSQYRAVRSVLGDHNAMLATVDPETRKALVAQSLAGQQGVYSGGGGVSAGGGRVLSDASPDPIRPGSQYAGGKADVMRAGGKVIFDAIAAALAGKIALENRKTPGPGSNAGKLPAVPDAPSVVPNEDPPKEGKEKLPDDCEEEIAEAVKDCTTAQLNNWKGDYGKGMYKTPGVKNWGVPECVRVRLSERCGGIPVQYTPWKKKKR
jgi:hypothetical protein